MDRFITDVAVLQDAPEPVAAHAYELEDGFRVASHRHPRAQLVYAIRGVLAATTPQGRWTVPPQRALWVPPDVEHALIMQGPVVMRTLYVRGDAVTGMPAAPRAVMVTDLLRELILRLLSQPDGPTVPLVADLILAELGTLPEEPLCLPWPIAPALRRFADAVAADPGDRRPLADWAGRLGLGARTFSRRFQAETGMSPGAWRQQARLLCAFTALARREPVTRVALDLGYQTPSAFIEAFRLTFGCTPKRYFGKR